MRPRSRLINLAVVIAAMIHGCASLPYVRGVREYAPTVAQEFRDYAEADSTIDTATRADHLAAADALDAAQKAEPLVMQNVRSAWQRVRGPYAAYVENDLDLDPDEKRLRAENIARMDRLNESEALRWIYGESGG